MVDIVICRDYLGKEHTVKRSDLIKRHAVYGVYIADKKVLLIKEKHVDRWDFPGGAIEKGENEAEGLKREFIEETGLDISSDITFIKQTHEYYFSLGSNEGWDSTRSFFLITNVLSGNLMKDGNKDDTLAARFFSLAETLDKGQSVLIPFYREILKQASQML